MRGTGRVGTGFPAFYTLAVFGMVVQTGGLPIET